MHFSWTASNEKVFVNQKRTWWEWYQSGMAAWRSFLSKRTIILHHTLQKNWLVDLCWGQHLELWVAYIKLVVNFASLNSIRCRCCCFFPPGRPGASSRDVSLSNLVCVDEKSGEQAVSPERVEEQAVLLGVEDLKPHLVSLQEPEYSRAWCYVMVPRVGVESLDLVLAVVDETDRQVLVSQRDVIAEVVHTRDSAGELAAAGVVMVAFVHQDAVEADGRALLRVTLANCDRESWAGLRPTATSTRDASFTQISHFTLHPRQPTHPRRPLCPLQTSRPRPPYNSLATLQSWFSRVPRTARLPWNHKWKEDKVTPLQPPVFRGSGTALHFTCLLWYMQNISILFSDDKKRECLLIKGNHGVSYGTNPAATLPVWTSSPSPYTSSSKIQTSHPVTQITCSISFLRERAWTRC